MSSAQQYAREGKDWVVDIDIAKFFDHVNHDILMGRIGKVIRDKRVLGLIGKYLRRGAMVGGLVEASVEGTPQGGPLTLLANICLDALDKELERRGHTFCRYADDCAPQHLRRQSGGGGADAGVGSGLDREASAAAGEYRQERDGEGLGTQVSGLSTEPRFADWSSAGEYRAIQSEGAGEVAKLPEPNRQPTAGRLEALCPGLVGLLPAG